MRSPGRSRRPRAIRVEEQHAHLAAVAGVDQPRRVHERDPVARARAGSRQHQPACPRDLDRDPGADARPLPRLEHRGLGGVQVEARVAVVRAGGQAASSLSRHRSAPWRGRRSPAQAGGEPFWRPFTANSENRWAAPAGTRACTSTPSERSSRSRSPASSCSSDRRAPRCRGPAAPAARERRSNSASIRSRRLVDALARLRDTASTSGRPTKSRGPVLGSSKSILL